jgi:hypothetical protein
MEKTTRLAWRFVLAVWILFAMAAAVRTGLSPERHTVFPILAGSSTHFWSDQPLYGDYRPLDYFRYPPVFAVAITPLASCGLTVGGILWIWLGMAVYAAGLVTLLRNVLPSETWSAANRVTYLLLALLGAAPGIMNAQSNALAIGMVLLGMSAVMQQRWWPAAWWLGGAVALKLTPLVVVLILSALYPRRLPGRVVVAVLAIGLVPFLVTSPASAWRHYEEWCTHLSSTSGKRWPGFRDAWTLVQVARHSLGLVVWPIDLEEPLVSPFYRVCQLLTATAVLVGCLLTQALVVDPRRRATLVLALPLAWLMLFGPAMEHAGYAFLAPVLAWTLVDRTLPKPSRILFFCAGMFILAVAPLSSGLLRLAALPLGSVTFFLGLLLCQPVSLNRLGWSKSSLVSALRG